MLICTATNVTPGNLSRADGTADYDVWVGINRHKIWAGRVAGFIRAKGADALLHVIADKMQAAERPSKTMQFEATDVIRDDMRYHKVRPVSAESAEIVPPNVYMIDRDIFLVIAEAFGITRAEAKTRVLPKLAALNGKPVRVPECPTCLEEEGSYSCVRSSHTPVPIPLSLEKVVEVVRVSDELIKGMGHTPKAQRKPKGKPITRRPWVKE